eukprot:gene13183-9029_t
MVSSDFDCSGLIWLGSVSLRICKLIVSGRFMRVLVGSNFQGVISGLRLVSSVHTDLGFGELTCIVHSGYGCAISEYVKLVFKNSKIVYELLLFAVNAHILVFVFCDTLILRLVLVDCGECLHARLFWVVGGCFRFVSLYYVSGLDAYSTFVEIASAFIVRALWLLCV